MRSLPLSICTRHHEPTTYTAATCPVCERDARILALLTHQKAVQDARCAECKKNPVTVRTCP